MSGHCDNCTRLVSGYDTLNSMISERVNEPILETPEHFMSPGNALPWRGGREEKKGEEE